MFTHPPVKSSIAEDGKAAVALNVEPQDTRLFVEASVLLNYTFAQADRPQDGAVGPNCGDQLEMTGCWCLPPPPHTPPTPRPLSVRQLWDRVSPACVCFHGFAVHLPQV